ncbi:hypothetical protein OAB01_00040 [Bacteroidia bacterium]|nr:hypothetical protein [Bacteroidia bacterium]
MKLKIFSISLIYLLLISCNQEIDNKIDETNSAVEKLSSSIDDLQSQNTQPRFKIVQPIKGRLITYKLDSYNGDVWIFNDAKWDLLRKNSYNDTIAEGKVNYEIFIESNGFVGYVYLFNVNTGVLEELDTFF